MTKDTNSIVPARAMPDAEARRRAALIVTSNAIEAIDIAEALKMRADADHRHLSTAEAALRCLEEIGESPLCLIFGLRLAEGPADRFIAIAAERGVPVLLIVDMKPTRSGFVFVQRPFTCETLDAALERIGF